MKPIFIENFLPEQILNLCYSYGLMKYSNNRNFIIDNQTNSFISEHSDYLMETLMDMSTSVVEQNVGKKLFPTYSFFRIYDKGDDLRIHNDRESCEYTVALCLGADPNNKPYEIFVGTEDENSDYKYLNKEGDFIKVRIENKFPMIPNNAVIFKGMDKIHWREVSKHDHFMTVFLHYVDQEGPYKEWKFDKRESLGFKKPR